MPSRPTNLWTFLTGSVGATVAAGGEGIRAAIERFQELTRADRPDFAAEGLLEGASDRDARTRMLRDLRAAGVPMEALRQAVEHDRLALVPVEGVLQGGGEHSLTELAAEAGLEEELLARSFTALGVMCPEAEARFNTDALAAAKALAELHRAGLSEATIEELCRILGSSVGSLARGVRELFRETFVDPHASEHDLGLRYAAAARQTLPEVDPVLRFTLTMTLLNLVRSDMVGHAQRVSGSVPGGREIAVCFADLAGFTSLTETRSPEEIGVLMRRFEGMVRQHAPPSARHVKMIGDGTMIVTDTARAAFETARSLVRAADALNHDFPRIHAGVATGIAIASGGDWYGPPINLASRLAECAPPGEIYTTEPIPTATGETYIAVGARRLDGIDHAVDVFALAQGR